MNLRKKDSERGDIRKSQCMLRMIENTLHPEDNKGCKKDCDHKTISQDRLDRGFRSLQSSESLECKRSDLMNQDKVPQPCEAANCPSPAEVQIDVKVGQLGSISLFLCNGCVGKFRDEKK